jgi:hypothetical protein
MIQNIHAHRGLAQISSCRSQDWGKIGKKVLFYSIFIFTSQISIASEAAGEVAATTTVDYLGTAFGIGSCANASVKLYSAGKDIKSYIFPNEEEQLLNSEINKKYVLAMARSKFKYCVANNKLTKKSASSGIPVVCEEAALMLIRCGGENEVIHTTDFFNKKMKGK